MHLLVTLTVMCTVIYQQNKKKNNSLKPVIQGTRFHVQLIGSTFLIEMTRVL